MATNWWNFTVPPDSIFSSDNQHFPTNISSYFRKPAKIIKPLTSRNQSPRNQGRRRMTTQVPARTRSVVDSHRPSRQSHWSMKMQPQTRPISWHPTARTDFSQTDLSQPQFPFLEASDWSQMSPYATANINGQVTPMSYPIQDEPQIQELITPLEELSAQEVGTHYLDIQQQAYPYWVNAPTKSLNDGFNSMMSTNEMSQMWWPTQQFNYPNVTTAPTSPEFLPMPDMGHPFAVSETVQQKEKDDLVGMGLYDSPADVQSASLLFDGPSLIARKSLKLEESFVPTETTEDDEGEGDGDQDQDEEDSSEDFEQEEQPTKVFDIHEDQSIQQPMVNDWGQYMVNNIQAAQFDADLQTGGLVDNQWSTSGYVGYGWI